MLSSQQTYIMHIILVTAWPIQICWCPKRGVNFGSVYNDVFLLCRMFYVMGEFMKYLANMHKTKNYNAKHLTAIFCQEIPYKHKALRHFTADENSLSQLFATMILRILWP